MSGTKGGQAQIYYLAQGPLAPLQLAGVQHHVAQLDISWCDAQPVHLCQALHHHKPCSYILVASLCVHCQELQKQHAERERDVSNSIAVVMKAFSDTAQLPQDGGLEVVGNKGKTCAKSSSSRNHLHDMLLFIKLSNALSSSLAKQRWVM